MFRDYLCKYLVTLDIQVREANTGRGGVEACREFKPDLVILDLGLPDIDGLRVVDELREGIGNATTRFLVVSGYCDAYTLYRADEARVHGFVSKADDSADVIKYAISLVGSGGTYYCDAFMKARNNRQGDAHFFGKLLSKREQYLLELIALGLSDDEIAAVAKIASSTVQTHRKHISHKLEISGTPKLIAFAHATGFTSLLRQP